MVAELECTADYEQNVKNAPAGKLVCVDFYAEWCGPCKLIAPTVANFATQEFTDVAFYKLNIETVPEVAQECSIRAMPTFILFRDGKTVSEVVGANPDALRAAIKAAI